MDADPTQNPYYYDWQIIFVKYCDGTGHQGYSAYPYNYNGDLIYFRGTLNTMETFRYALHKLGMVDATEILVSGGSAGGLAT